jgi:hypothetical protein
MEWWAWADSEEEVMEAFGRLVENLLVVSKLVSEQVRRGGEQRQEGRSLLDESPSR